MFQVEHLIALEKERQYDATVHGAFVTYEGGNDDGHSYIPQLKEQMNPHIFGQQVKMKMAKDPTNYIWENMGYSLARRVSGLVVSLIIMSFIIVFAFYW